MHERRRPRGEPLDAPVRERLDPVSALLARALEYADAPSEDDLAWCLAKERLLAAARRFARAQPAANEETSIPSPELVRRSG